MAKNFARSFVVILSFVVAFCIFNQTALAYFSGLVFAGRVVATEATEITGAESAGYDCEMYGGTSVTIKSVKGPTSYYIPSGTVPKSGHNIRPGQGIMGKYQYFEEDRIYCTRDEGDNYEDQSRIDFYLPSITLFSVSRR